MIRLHSDVFGVGDPAVFVHGSFGWGLDTFPHQRELADAYRVHLVDRAGFGRSAASAQLGWPTDMHDIAQILDEVGPAHLVGQSYGAVVALLAAGLRPLKIRSLLVIEPPLFGVATHDAQAASLAAESRRLADRAASLDDAGYVAAWAEMVLGLHGPALEAWTAGWSAEDWSAAGSSRREHTPVDAPVAFDVLADLAVPKVVVAGGWTKGTPTAIATGRAFRAVTETVAARIGAPLVIFEQSSHNPQLQEPAAFNQLLRQVWCGVSPAPGPSRADRRSTQGESV